MVAETDLFICRTQELGLADVSRYYWYHTIDLGNGLITPGVYDYRDTIGTFGFPKDMRGMTVLDVGSATGFFAFEFERRGAQVVSLELPSLEALDRFPGQSLESVLVKIDRMMFPEEQHRGHSAADLYEYLLEGPFRFCAERLGSRVERCYSTVYDVSLPGRQFDLVFIGDVLVHTLYPLKALAALAPLCRGTLILAQTMPDGDKPAMDYVGGDDPAHDDVSWWLPNKQCFTQILRKLGFAEVRQIGSHTGVLRSSGYRFERPILHAVR
jgi:SAM-dependent methyltransferase